MRSPRLLVGQSAKPVYVAGNKDVNLDGLIDWWDLVALSILYCLNTYDHIIVAATMMSDMSAETLQPQVCCTTMPCPTMSSRKLAVANVKRHMHVITDCHLQSSGGIDFINAI